MTYIDKRDMTIMLVSLALITGKTVSLYLNWLL